MNLYIFPYNQASESAKALAHELQVKRIKREGSHFKGSKEKVVINWGSRELPEEVGKCRVINSPRAIELCADKLKFFRALEAKGISRFVPFTTDREQAEKWIGEKKTVMCRTILNGHSGQGLVVAETIEELVKATLYTLYIPKKDEYRIHVFRGQPFIFQRKAINVEGKEVEHINWKVRNVANGFIFARHENEPIPEDVTEQAKNAFNSIEGLDFCSVDVIWNEHRKQAFVLEINTASGLTGTTIKDYANKFKEIA